MTDPECDNCGRDLDDDDLKAEICVCGAPLPPETIKILEAKYGAPKGKAMSDTNSACDAGYACDD